MGNGCDGLEAEAKIPSEALAVLIHMLPCSQIAFLSPASAFFSSQIYGGGGMCV